MKSVVACLFLVASFTLPTTIVPAQTTRQGTSKPRNETIKICQGLPIPGGYIVVAFMTSSACPHGAYLLKKQDEAFPKPVAGNRGGRPPSTTTASEKPGAANRRVQTSSTTPDGLSRPRRAGTASTPTDDPTANAVAQTQTEPPSANAAAPTQTESPSPARDVTQVSLRPPKLLNTAVGTPVNATATAVPVAGPEEVSEGDVVRINTTLVAVPVSVLDRQGRFVPNLRKEDFSIFENGIEQSIAYFEPAEKPFTVALLLDVSASTRFHLWEIKEAAIAFAKQLRPQDRVLIVTFSDEVLLLTEVTNDANIINTVIEQNANPGSSTRLYDAVTLVINERLNKIKGRKAIVLFTDGVDTASRMATYQSTLREAEELDALIYPVQYDTTDYMRAMQGGGTITIVTTRSNGPWQGTTTSQTTQGVPLNGGVPLPGTTQADYDRADQYLRQLADKSGGRLYRANDTSQLAQAFSLIAEELRRQYSLGYYPQTATVESDDRRQIKVKVRQPNLAVKSRDGYVRSPSTTPAK